MEGLKIKFEVRSLFLPLWEREERYLIAMGGRARGASTAISQYLVSRLPAKEYMRCAIMRANHSDIRVSNWKEIIDRVDEQNIRAGLNITDNDMKVTCGVNSIQAVGFRQSSVSHSAKLKSLASFNVVWIEEAEEVGEEEFRTLDDTLRTVKGNIKIILSVNPPHKNHWIVQRFFNLKPSEKEKFYIPALKEKNAYHFGGTFRDNLQNLDEASVERYKNYKKDKPDYYWQMIEGLVPEVLRGKIFSGWQQIETIPHEAKLVAYGLDGGWYPDPTALVAIYEYLGGYIVDELLYGTEIDNETIAATIRQTNKDILCNADLDERSVDAIKKLNVHIVRVEKKPDSVQYRIKLTTRQKISVTSRSENVWKSYENYAWKETKDGDPVGRPDHFMSDCADAIMYGIQSLPVAEVEYEDHMEKVKRRYREQREQGLGLHNIVHSSPQGGSNPVF